ncbi:MAG: transposase [Nitrospirae bacterium]|nr:transposase [Nitrospirota bacterium]
MMYVGLDLHKKFSYVVGTDEKGETKVQMRLEHHDGSVRDFFGSIQEPCQVAVEATSNWYWLVDELESMGVEVVLSHPSKTRAIAEAKEKQRAQILTWHNLLHGRSSEGRVCSRGQC